MSTYLACFVICDFDYKQAEINAKGIGKNFTLRTYGQKDKLHNIDFALDIGKRATEYYIQYYRVPYPLPKLGWFVLYIYIYLRCWSDHTNIDFTQWDSETINVFEVSVVVSGQVMFFTIGLKNKQNETKAYYNTIIEHQDVPPPQFSLYICEIPICYGPLLFFQIITSAHLSSTTPDGPRWWGGRWRMCTYVMPIHSYLEKTQVIMVWAQDCTQGIPVHSHTP